MGHKLFIQADKSGAEGFFRRAREHARLLDKGAPLPDETVIAFEYPADLLRMLSEERLRLLDSLRSAGESPLTELAVRLGRDKRAVSRDIAAMRHHGLVRTRYVVNPGHGRNLVVMPVAKRVELKAAI